MDEKLNARRELAERIVKMYENREHTQEQIAQELGIPINIIRQVLKVLDFEHTKKKTSENLNPGQTQNAVIFWTEMDFLDPYINKN